MTQWYELKLSKDKQRLAITEKKFWLGPYFYVHAFTKEIERKVEGEKKNRNR